MRRISSRFTFYVKRIVPLIGTGMFLFIAVDQLVRGSSPEKWLAPVLAMIGIPFGYFIMRFMGLFELADVVVDEGDALIIRKGGRERRIAMSEITEVSSFSSLPELPWRIFLSLRTPGIFGAQVSFMAPLRMLPFLPNPILRELLERVERERKAPLSGT